MGRMVHRACEQCAQKCALFHGKGKSSSQSPSSFVKVMVGDDFSRVLYFPPKFSSTVSAFVNKKMTLKDSSGQRWTATVTTVDNSFVLEGGWNAFASDHGLEIGDFLVFNYSHDLQLDVIIYGRSCCERLDFSKRKNNKRRRRDRSGSPVRQGPNASVIPEPDVPKMNGQSREVDVGRTQNISKSDKSNGGDQSMGITENSGDPCHMTSQDYCGVDETRKISIGNSKVFHVDYASRVYQNDATQCNKYPLFEGTMDSGAALDASKVELLGKTLGDIDRSAYDKTSTSKLEENRRNDYIMSNREVQECQFAEDLESDHVVTSKEKQSTNQMFNSIPNVSGEMPNTMKKECVDRSSNGSSFKAKLSAEGVMPETMKKDRVDRAPNRSSLKDKSHAEGVMPKTTKKERVDSTPNESSLKDKLCSGEMPKTMKKECVERSSNGRSFKDKLSAGVMPEMMKKERVDRSPNGSSLKDKSRAEGVMPEMMKKERVDRAPNGSSLKDKSRAEGEMPKTMKKECVDRFTNGSSFKDKLSAEGVISETMKKERVDRAPNGSSLKDKSHAEGVMPKTMKKECVDSAPNESSLKDKLCEGVMSKRIEKEHVDMTLNLPSPKYELGGTGSSKFIKQEFDQNSLSLAAVSCVVPSDNDDFLELPTRLPYCYRGRVKMDRMVVLLRDPQRQLWPVLYHEQPGLKVLTAGWSRFGRASNIQPADVCTFGLEDDSRHVYTVDIVCNR